MPKMPGAGDLDKRAIIQERREPAEFGFEFTYANIETVSVARRDISASERFMSNQDIAVKTAVFTMRYRSYLTPIHRLWHENKAWDIVGIAELGRRQWHLVTARAEN